MRITDKISFRQPKYMLPAIVYIPLIATGYFVFDMFNTEVAETQDKNLQTTEFLNPNLPGAQIKNGDGIGGKYENMAKSYGRIADYSAVDNIERDNEEEKEAYESKYTEEDLAELVRQAEEKDDAAEVADAKAREAEALEALNKALAEARLRGQAAVAPVAQDTTQAGPPKEQIEVKGQIAEDSKAVKALDEEDKAQEVVKKVKVTSDYFNTLTQNEHEPKLIKAIIDEDVKATDGSRVRLRLLDDIEIGETVVKKGSYLYATMSGFGSQRVKGSINSILVDDELIKVSLSLYDTDGLEGDHERSGERCYAEQHEHRPEWSEQQFLAMGNASRDQCLPEDKQCHQQGYQEEQSESEVWDVCLPCKWEREKEIDTARQRNCRERWLIEYKHQKIN